VLQHTVHDAYDSELELELGLEEAEMQVTMMRIDLTSFVVAAAAENAVLLVTFSESLRENAVELGFAMFAAVPSDDDVYSKFGAMQIVVDVVVDVAVAGAVVVAAAAGVV